MAVSRCEEDLAKKGWIFVPAPGQGPRGIAQMQGNTRVFRWVIALCNGLDTEVLVCRFTQGRFNSTADLGKK